MNILLLLSAAVNILMIFLYFREKLYHSIARTGLVRLMQKYGKDLNCEEFAELCMPDWIDDSLKERILKTQRTKNE